MNPHDDYDTLDASYHALRAQNAALREALMGFNRTIDARGFCSCPLDDPTAPQNEHSTQCQQARAALAKDSAR